MYQRSGRLKEGIARTDSSRRYPVPIKADLYIARCISCKLSHPLTLPGSEARMRTSSLEGRRSSVRDNSKQGIPV